MSSNSTKNSNVNIILHISAWLVFIILPQFVINRYWDDNNFIPWSFFASIAIYGLIFYLNLLWLIPRFYLNSKKTQYFILLLAFILVLFFLNSLLDGILREQPFDKSMPKPEFGEMPKFKKSMPDFKEGMEPPGKKGPPIQQLDMYFFFLISFIITGFSLGLKLIQKQSVSEKRQQELEKQKINSELAFLKNQVSPHFFFNTLNNIYSLVEINTKDAQKAILKLSKLMRYLLYESEGGKTQLSQEIDFMEHYIDLMRLRLSPKVEVNIRTSQNSLNHKIPPLLFIPFIENAFKHGISYRQKSFIKIYMQTEKNKVSFICMNSLGKTKNDEIDNKHSGIGLENVRKRLNLLFPGKHILNIDETGETFTVSLEIELNKIP